VSRLIPYRNLLLQHLAGVRVDFLDKRGGGVSFVERQIHAAAHYDIVILMVGGNDIDNGMSPTQLADRIGYAASHMVSDHGAGSVMVSSLWPRRNSAFNRRALEFADIMERRHYFDGRVAFWLWDRRQPWHTYDGVHLDRHGYQVAMRYLQAQIVWAIHHNLW